MKRILTLVLSLIMLCSSFVFTASMADATIEGLAFEPNTIYKVENDLEAEPITIEAVIYANKRLKNGSVKGVIFGNEKGIANAPCMSLKLTGNGIPQLYVKGYKWTEDNAGEAYACTFENAAVIQSEWVHLTIVRDLKKEEVRCYVNGELTDTVPAKDVGPIGLYDFAVGGDRTSHNTNYLKNAKLRSLSVYSDMRTEAEIKKDMESLDKSGLILHYDFSALTEKNPAILPDLSDSKNNANFNRIFFDEKEPVTDYAYSFAVIGDTQKVALYYPENFKKIYEYIYDNIESKNIEMVIGLGDITDTNNGDNTEYEWQVALDGMKVIDDYVPHIPIRGNHDSIFWYNKMMSQTNYADLIDGKYVENDIRNTYVDFSVGGIPYLFLNLDFDMSWEELEWACKVVEQFPNHNVIVSRHGHMNHDYTPLTRGEWLNPGLPRLSGDELWDNLLSKYENIVLCLSGHIGSELVVTTQRKGVNGNTVTEMLLDFQDCDVSATNAGFSEGGLGTVNMFYFSEDGSKLTVETYATINGKYFHDHNQFTIELDMVTDTKYVKGEKKDVPPRVESTPTEIKMTIDSLTASVNGESKTLDAAPIIRNSRTMLPVRFVAENLGAEVGWDDATKTVSVKSADTTIEIVIGATTAKVNGAVIALDSPAFIENSRTYLPVRVVAENLGAEVSWDDTTKTATLTK